MSEFALMEAFNGFERNPALFSAPPILTGSFIIYRNENKHPHVFALSGQDFHRHPVAFWLVLTTSEACLRVKTFSNVLRLEVELGLGYC